MAALPQPPFRRPGTPSRRTRMPATACGLRALGWCM